MLALVVVDKSEDPAQGWHGRGRYRTRERALGSGFSREGPMAKGRGRGRAQAAKDGMAFLRLARPDLRR